MDPDRAKKTKRAVKRAKAIGHRSEKAGNPFRGIDNGDTIKIAMVMEKSRFEIPHMSKENMALLTERREKISRKASGR